VDVGVAWHTGGGAPSTTRSAPEVMPMGAIGEPKREIFIPVPDEPAAPEHLPLPEPERAPDPAPTVPVPETPLPVSQRSSW
jgi:hypothetical protein